MSLDVARAIAVIGVVFNHAVDGLLSADLLGADDWIAQFNSALYIFRMPALAFLLGIFIPRSVEKRGRWPYLRHRAYVMIWVYLLWTLMQGTVQVVLSSVTNGQMTFARVFSIWIPIAQLWFLPALITMTATVVLLRTWGSKWAWGRVALLLIPALALWGTAPDIAGVRGFSLVLFVGAGAAVGLAGFERLARISLWWWLVAGLLAAVAFLVVLQWPLIPATLRESSELVERAASILGASLGVVVLLALAMLLARVPVLRGIVADIGLQTMPIYLMHILILAGVRILLSRWGVPAELMLIVAIPLAVAIPWIIGKNARRLRLNWLFEPPRRSKVAATV